MGFLAAAAPFVELASAGIGAIGAIEQGQATSAMANYQAQVARNNAVIASQYARNAAATGEEQAYQQGLRNRQKLGALVSGLAANGLDVNTGSPASLRESADQSGLTDVQTLRQEAALRSYGYNVDNTSYASQAALDTAEARQAGTAGFLKAGGLLFGGISAVSPKFQSLFDSANPGGSDLGTATAML